MANVYITTIMSFTKLITIFAVIASLAVIAGQRYFGHGPSRQINYNSIDFPAANSIRDARQNRGEIFEFKTPDTFLIKTKTWLRDLASVSDRNGTHSRVDDEQLSKLID
uniref:Uncharacterized protein n=1 Tax=Glossina brevipalpis TaxID=37001 RepID=A0A1A9WEE4_9MUSC